MHMKLVDGLCFDVLHNFEKVPPMFFHRFNEPFLIIISPDFCHSSRGLRSLLRVLGTLLEPFYFDVASIVDDFGVGQAWVPHDSRTKSHKLPGHLFQ